MPVNKTDTYPLADRIPYTQIRALGLDRREYNRSGSERFPYQTVRAVWTGEKRCPVAGEWFLSGSEIEAYHATNDLTRTYHIAHLIRVD